MNPAFQEPHYLTGAQDQNRQAPRDRSPDQLPHPANIVIDMKAGDVRIQGPMTPDDTRRQEDAAGLPLLGGPA